MTLSIIQLVELAFDYQEVPLLHDINFQLDAGDLLHIQGANGAGKTTLLKLLAGLHHPSQGEIHYKGVRIDDDLASYQHNLCFVGHKTGISPYLTVQENCYFDSQYQQNSDLQEPIAAFKLDKHLHSLCGVLSAGQKRKVGLLRLWFSEAELWLLDEPFVALDEDALGVLMAQIKRHRDKGGIVILTSHQRLPLEQSTYRSYCL